MSEQFVVKAELRQDVGKGASRRLRREANLIPAIIYGANKPAQNVTVVHKDIIKFAQNEAFFSSILSLDVNGKKEKAILKDMQRHPNKAIILHMDFMRVSATEKLTMHVPLHLIGEEEAKGVKEGGVVTKHMTELDVKCLPADLPESIDIDITDLALDGSIHISGIKLPAGVELLHPIEDDAHDHPVVSIAEPKIIEEPEENEAAPEAGDVPSDQKDDAADEADDAEKAAEEKADA